MADPHSSKAPAFQFYPNDFLSDANVIVMSLQERGVYITLICVCWQQGSLPNNVEQLARFCGSPVTVFRKMWPAVERCFRVSGERLTHPRLERERKKQREYRKLQSDKGKASAASRKGTAVEPRLKSGSTEGQPEVQTPVQPKANSSVFDLRSASSDFGQKSAARGVGGGVMAGSLPRDHVNCHQPCIRVCLSEKQHGILRERHGGTDADLDAFYADVRGRLEPGIPIGETPWKFWDAQFQARYGAAAVVNPRTAGNAAAAARFAARGQA